VCSKKAINMYVGKNPASGVQCSSYWIFTVARDVKPVVEHNRILNSN